MSLADEEYAIIRRLCLQLVEMGERAGYKFKSEIVEKLLMVICYEIMHIYMQRTPIPQNSRSRNDSVFQQFLFALAKNYLHEREVEFYASLLCLTPRYLSTIVKEKSGKNASQWIAQMVILQAKALLTSSQRTIQQIAEELNFSNASFFSQYFKKHTGMTPRQFRETK